jgi:hypothetical protein
MEEITEEAAELVARVAALDIGKASLVACVRVPHESRPGARRQEVRTLRPSFIPPPWQRGLRDLCRYRRTLIQERTREK